MILAMALPWYYSNSVDIATISNGRVFEDRQVEKEYLTSFSVSYSREDSVNGETFYSSESQSWSDTIYAESLSSLITICLGTSAATLILSLVVLLASFLLLLSFKLDSVGEKISPRVYLLLTFVISLIALALALITIFAFFAHTNLYKNDIETAGKICRGGPCETFFWNSQERNVRLNTVNEISWGPDSGWILFVLGTILLGLISIFSSPCVSRDTSGCCQ